MLKRILAQILIVTQSFAALPPTTLKGQSESTKPTTFNFQVPYNQATTTGGATRLIETGNANLLANPSFEHTSYLTSWAQAAGSYTQDTTNKVDGANGVSISLSAVNGDVLSQCVTPTQQMSGLSVMATIFAKTTSTTFQLCQVQGSTDVNCVNIRSDGNWAFYQATFPGPSSGQICTKIKTSSSTTGTINVDMAGIQFINTPVVNVSSQSDPISFTPTGSWVTNTTYTGKYWQDGAFGFLDYYVTTTGAPTSASLTLNLPSGWTIDTARMADSSVNTDTPLEVLGGSIRDAGTIVYSVPKAYYNTSTSIAIQVANNSSGTIVSDTAVNATTPMTWASGDELWIRVKIPVTNFSAFQGAASVACLTNGQCENLFSAKVAANGTVTEENVDFINGNCTNAANSVCTWNTSFFSVAPNCGLFNSTTGGNQTNTNGGQAHTISTTGGTFASTDATGSSAVTRDKVIFCQRAGSDYRPKVPAPILTGSMISASPTQAENNIRALINCDASSSITSQNGTTTTAVASVGNRSSATCALTLATGAFSSTPWKCNVTVSSTTVQSTGCTCASATSCTIAGPNADYDAWVDIAGPR